MTIVDSRPRLAFAPLIGISLAYFMVLLDTTVLAVAGPDLIASLRIGVLDVGAVTTAYTVALASTLVLGGGIADRVGAHRMLFIGVVGFGLISLACASAPSLPVLVALRAVLGLLAAAIIPASLSLVGALHHDPQTRARAIGIWAAVSGSAMAAGPVLGGLLVDVAGWRSVFAINAPLALVVVLLARRRVDTPRRALRLSWAPHLGLAATLATTTFAIGLAGDGDGTAAIVSGLAALVLGVLTARADRRADSPLVPAGLRRSAGVWAACGWGAAVNYALTTVLFALPLLLPGSAGASGAILLPMTILIAVNPLLTARIVARHGALRPIRMGLLALPAGLAVVGIGLAAGQPIVLMAGLLSCGLGVSWTLPALVGYAVDHATAEDAGAVGGILNAARQLGATLAAAVASTALSAGAPTATPFVIAVSVCIVALAGSRRRRR